MSKVQNLSKNNTLSTNKSLSGFSRRDILRGGMAGGVFVLATSLSACGNAQDELTKTASSVAPPLSDALEELNLFVSIDETGRVQIMCHRAEMGQHARTGMARVIADELEADWSKIEVMQTEGEAKYGDQNTDGSTTIRRDFTRLRRIGASARSMLEQAAAKEWGVPVNECKAVMHEVLHGPSSKRLGYGELASIAATLTPPAFEGEGVEENSIKNYRLKAPNEWRYIGKAAPSVDLDDILQGKAEYGQDLSMPGMKYAVIARSPVLYGKIKSFDEAAAMAVSGVEKVIPMPAGERPADQREGGFNPLNGIAVIANNTWAANQGRLALNAQWQDGQNAAYNSADYRLELENSVKNPQKIVRKKGDVDQALGNASKTLSADYYVPHLAHAQMEPPAALAKFEEGQLEVWTSTQNPQQARLDLVEIMGLEYENIRVNNALLGGAFGRKSKPDFVYEAALLAREMGVPVKVVWTREDDLHHDYFHAVSAQHFDAAMDEDGNTIAWRQRVSFPSIGSTFNPAAEYGSDGEMGLGFIDNPLNIPNLQLENGKAKGQTRIGWLRSVNNIQHAFAAQSFAAELAHAAGRDPKEYLLSLIGPDRIIKLEEEGLVNAYSNYGQPYDEHPIDTARLKNVINLAAKGIGWNANLGQGHGMGIAGHRSFLSYVATAVEVKVAEDGTLEIANVHVACDCGVAVNPASVRMQMEGASVFALSNILASEITITGGRVDQSNFDTYEMGRIHQAPKNIEVTLVESNAPPGGVGEPGTPPFAPALTNAIFAATGKRIRSLPIGDKLKA